MFDNDKIIESPTTITIYMFIHTKITTTKQRNILHKSGFFVTHSPFHPTHRFMSSSLCLLLYVFFCMSFTIPSNTPPSPTTRRSPAGHRQFVRLCLLLDVFFFMSSSLCLLLYVFHHSIQHTAYSYHTPLSCRRSTVLQAMSSSWCLLLDVFEDLKKTKEVYW